MNFSILNISSLFLSLKKYLFIFRKGKGERKRGRETSMCGCLWHAPHWGPGPQPRHVPWLEFKSATLWFTGWHSIHWTTPARAKCLIFEWIPAYLWVGETGIPWSWSLAKWFFCDGPMVNIPYFCHVLTEDSVGPGLGCVCGWEDAFKRNEQIISEKA